MPRQLCHFCYVFSAYYHKSLSRLVGKVFLLKLRHEYIRMSDMYEVIVRGAKRSYKSTHLWVICTRLEGSRVLMLLCTGA